MRISQLVVENVLRCKFIDITPNNDEAVILEGKNKEGKTSVLNSVEMLFSGGRSIPDKPINKDRDEKEASRIVATLTPDEKGNEFIITRHWTGKGSYIKVENKEGLGPSSPQGWLDSITRGKMFRPEVFLASDEVEKIKILKDVAGLDFNDLEEKYNELYEERKGVNSHLKTLSGQLVQYQDVDDLPDEKLRTSRAIRDDIEKMSSYNRKINQAIEDTARENDLRMEKFDKIKEHEKAIKKLTTEIKEHEKNILRLEKKGAEKLKSAESLYKELDNVEKYSVVNERIQQKSRIVADLDEVEANKSTIEAQMKSLKLEKQERIKESNMPIEGLDIKDGKVYYNDFPLSQASQAEQIEVTMAIAMALMPKLQIILIRTAKLLDGDSFKKIKKIAEKNDFQLWLEIVEDAPTGGKNTFFIEDGGVKTFEEIKKRLK